MSCYVVLSITFVIAQVLIASMPRCSKSGSWDPLNKVTNNRRDTTQYSTHFCLVKYDEYFSEDPHPFTWDEAAAACNFYRGFLLYSFNISHLKIIIETYSSELSTSGRGVAQATQAQRMLFISLHDRREEGVLEYDMRWLEGSESTFTAPINQTEPNSALQQLIRRGQLQDGTTIWNPSENGKLPTTLYDKFTNNVEERDCMAVVLLPDGDNQPLFVNCELTPADQAICIRDGGLSTKSKPCHLNLLYDQLTTRTDVFGIAAIHSANLEQTNQFFYAEKVSDAMQTWLRPSLNISTFMLPSAKDVYFLVLCKPGWFPTAKYDYPVSIATCRDNSDISYSGTYDSLYLCKFYDGCQYPSGDKSFDKGAHITHCSSQGYCQPDKAQGVVSCICQLGFRGDSCETIDYDPCNDTKNPEPCGRGQTCVSQQRDFYCVCKGKLAYNKYGCQYDIDECENNPCRNNATCIGQLNTFYCECKQLEDPVTKQKVKYANGDVAYWHGQLCDRDPINSCKPNPCVGKPDTDYVDLHGSEPAGICRDQVVGFVCACDYPWSGSICEVYDSDNIVQAVTGRRLSLIYVYLALFIIFNFACMLLTLLRRREITQGRYKTEEMIISAYESEKKVERDKLMQFVEDAAYSSDDESHGSERLRQRPSSHTKVEKSATGLGPWRAAATRFGSLRSKSNVPQEVSASAVNLQEQDHHAGEITTETDSNTNVGFQDNRSLTLSKGRRNSKRRKPRGAKPRRR